jgi:hypothetical protein
LHIYEQREESWPRGCHRRSCIGHRLASRFPAAVLAERGLIIIDHPFECRPSRARVSFVMQKRALSYPGGSILGSRPGGSCSQRCPPRATRSAFFGRISRKEANGRPVEEDVLVPGSRSGHEQQKMEILDREDWRKRCRRAAGIGPPGQVWGTFQRLFFLFLLEAEAPDRPIFSSLC